MSRLELPVCVVDLDQHVVHRDGQTFPLTAIEGKLLAWFAANAGRTVSRDELLTQVWGYRPGIESRTVQSTIHRVREKIEADPSDPVVLRTVYGVGYRFDPPPPEDDRLIGRAAALREVSDRLGAERLVTIAGPGGVGKTTLARRVAELHGGAVFCDLSTARTPDELVRAVAGSIGVELPPGPVADRARAVMDLADGVTLLVLDNLEQLEAPAVTTIGAWGAAPFRILGTSRHVLSLPGEAVVELAPLEAPAAARLFRARGRLARPELELAEEDADVATIVDLIDRLPLAIELVAARAALLALPELRARLESGRLAVGSGSDRRASLDAALRWSWDLLDEAEQRTLAQLSVFAGAWTLESAEAVLAPHDALIDALEGLRRKALVRVGAPGSQTFHMLTTVRRFAADRLAERPDAADAIRRHARWFAERGWRFAGLASGRRDIAAAGADLPEVSAALGRGATLDGETHARLAIVAFRSLGASASPAVLAAAERTDVPSPVRALLLGVVAHLQRTRGDTEVAAGTMERAFEAADGDSGVLSQLYTFRTVQAMARRDWDLADEAAQRADEHAARSGLSVARLAALLNRAIIAWYSGRADASARFEDVQQLAEQVGDDMALAGALSSHGGLHVDAGRLDRALPLLSRAVGIAERLPRSRDLAISLNNLAACYREQGRLDEAEEAFRRAIAHLRRGGFRAEPTVAKLNLGWIALERGKIDEAAAAASEGLDVLGRNHPHFVVEARILAAAAAHARGWSALAREHYDAAIDAIPASDRRRPRLVARRAVLDPTTAAPILAEARASCEAAGRVVDAAEIEVLTGIADVAEGRPEAARQRIAAANAPRPGLAAPTPAAWSADVRLAVRLVEAALRR